MPDAALDSALKDRLREVLDRRAVTEAELRKLLDEGHACARLVRGRLERGEERLTALADDPEAALADVASALRTVNDLRPRLAELERMLGELEERAPELRRSWLAARPAG